jgi:signal transduction histidine kinase
MPPAFQYSPTIWPQLAVALTTALLAAYVWPRRAVPGARPYLLLLVVYACASLLLALMLTATALPLKFAFRQAWALCVLIEALGILALALDYSGRARSVRAWGWALIVLPLAVAAGFIITAQWHSLMWQRELFGGSMHAAGGIAQTFSAACVYTLIAVALAVLVAALVHSRGVFRFQAGFLIAGISLITFGESFDILGGNVSPSVDVSAICSIVGTLVSAIALFRFGTFDLVPVARDRLVERMKDGLLVLDARGRVIDLNPAAGQHLSPLPAAPVGRLMEDVVRGWPELLAALQSPPVTAATISRGTDPAAGAYLLSIQPITGPRGQPAGRLITWHDVTRLRQQTDESAQQRQALATLAERDRLGKELHDGLCQTLGFVRMETQAARDALSIGQLALADTYLARIVAVTQDAQDDVREFLLAVHTGNASVRGLFEELDGFLARYRLHHPFRIEVVRPPTLTDDAIEPSVQVQLLRIIQESLANARRHAAATEVHITFACVGDDVHLTIEDNGQGFDPEALDGRRGDHYGLRFMRERAEEVNGALQIETAPGQGFKVKVRVPARRGEPICAIKRDSELAGVAEREHR